MKNLLQSKFLAIGILILLLLIPLSMIDSLVENRQQLQHQVQQDIARSSSTEQQIIGPILVLEYKKTQIKQFTNNIAGNSISKPEVSYYNKVHLPAHFQFDSTLDTQYRSRGIYKALLYQANSELSGYFKFAEDWLSQPESELIKASMILAITDVRGIRNGLDVTFNQQKFPLEPGTGTPHLGSGVHVPLKLDWLNQQKQIEFKLALNLQGMEKLQLSPIGRETNINIKANWPHPSFTGQFLPLKPEISAEGFSANWQTSFFSTNMPELINLCIVNRKCKPIKKSTLGVALIDPVDQYLKTDRAIKYAELFILLTLFAFMLFEVFKRMAIHPIQYAMVGLSLALFYLLLLSLSEHIGFDLAYLLSSISCATVIGVYISGVLKQIKHGIMFSIGLMTLYLILFGLLAAEDYALVMGAIFVFFILTLVMIITRKIDWYQFHKSTE